MRCWLGDVKDFTWEIKAAYALPDGTHGEVRVFKPHSHVRLTWFPLAYPRASTIQVRVISKDDRAILVFHQEHLPDQQARKDRRAFFRIALDKIEAALTPL
jgi:hypothetical protein